MLYDRGMTALTISPAQRKALKAKAHDLSPVVMIGNDGLTPGVVKEAEIAIQSHNLIKVRVFGDDRENRIAIYEALCDKLSAAPVQHIGKLLVSTPSTSKTTNLTWAARSHACGNCTDGLVWCGLNAIGIQKVS